MSNQSNLPVAGQQVSERGRAAAVVQLECSQAFGSHSWGVPGAKWGNVDGEKCWKVPNQLGKHAENCLLFAVQVEGWREYGARGVFAGSGITWYFH